MTAKSSGIIRRIFIAFIAITAFFVSVFQFPASGQQYNDAWVLEYENVKKASSDESVVPTLFKNDAAFANHKRFPLVVQNNIAYVPLEMFIGLADTKLEYGYSIMFFYLSREKSSRYISFDVENNTVTTHNLKPYELETKVFYNTRYVPAIEVAKVLGINAEIYENKEEGVYALRLSDSKVKRSFPELIKIYSPIKREEPEIVTPPPVEDPPVTIEPAEIGIRNIYLSADVINISSISSILPIFEHTYPLSGITFFMTPKDILEHPDTVRQIIAYGQNIGFLLDSNDPISSYNEAKENLRLTANCSTRLVRFTSGSFSVKLDSEEYKSFIESNGLCVWDYNISVSDSKNMYNEIYDDLYTISPDQRAATAVIRIIPGTNTRQALRKLFETVNAKKQLTIHPWDETTTPYTVR